MPIFSKLLKRKPSDEQPDIYLLFSNWVLRGLQFYYRDTSATLFVSATYHVGDILRAGRMVEVTQILSKPVQHTRFVIASAHVVRLFETEGFQQSVPQAKEWELCALHPDSYFKVLDVYEKGAVTQVLLLHIPPSLAFLFAYSDVWVTFHDNMYNESTLVKMSRQRLEESMRLKVLDCFVGSEWRKRTQHPIGLDDHNCPIPLRPVREADEEKNSDLNELIHDLANDFDVDVPIPIKDDFLYDGIQDHVCNGCIYAKNIKGNGEGCGLLFINSFRNSYRDGICQFRKESVLKPSTFERLFLFRKNEEEIKATRQTKSYAIDQIKGYVSTYLGDDIQRLKEVNLLYPVGKGKQSPVGKNYNETELMKSILSICFGDVFQDLNPYSLDYGLYITHCINNPRRLWGTNTFLLGGRNVSDLLVEKVKKVERLIPTIGNQVVWFRSLGFGDYLEGLKARDYMDRLLKSMYEVMNDFPNSDLDMKSHLYHGRKQMAQYCGAEGFSQFVQDVWLGDFLDSENKPKEVFQYVWSSQKDLDSQTYFSAVEQYCDFVEQFIEKRSDRILDKIEKVLNN